MNAAFDIVSDLYLTGQEQFNWEGNPTSLFCLVPGNVSSDLTVLQKTLEHLSRYYQGVFFIDGSLENPDINFRDQRVKELMKICSRLQNVVYLHANVVIVDGIALVGINGWEEGAMINATTDIFQTKANRYEDIYYLEKTLERLQLHVDVRKIIVISNSVPAKELYFGQENPFIDDLFPVNVLYKDTENKISKWVYGTSNKMADTIVHGVNFVNNPKHDRKPYYPKRIEIEF